MTRRDADPNARDFLPRANTVGVSGARVRTGSDVSHARARLFAPLGVVTSISTPNHSPSMAAILDIVQIADVLLWVIVGAFVAGMLLDGNDRAAARSFTVGAWWLFALFWLLLTPYFAFVHKSIVEGVLAAIAVPACCYVGYHLLSGRDSLFVLSRAVGLMGLLYLPFETIALFHDTLIEVVANQTAWSIHAIGFDPTLTTDAESGLRSVFVFDHGGETYSTRIVFACTGIGSMAIFSGLVAAVRAPLRRRLAALGFAIATIWTLNIARNAFIAVSYGEQLFQHEALIGPVMWLFGLDTPALVSFYVADRIIAQGLAVVALVGIFLVVARLLPELLAIVEDLLFLLTGEEYGLVERPDATEPSVTDPAASGDD